MKKFILVGVIPLLVLVSACGGGGSTTSSGPAGASSSLAAAAPESTANAELCAELQSELDTVWEESVREQVWKKARERMELFNCPMPETNDARQAYVDFIAPRMPAMKKIAKALLKCAQQPEWNSQAKQVCSKAALGTAAELEIYGAFTQPSSAGLPEAEPSFDCLVERTVNALAELTSANSDLMDVATGNDNSNLRLDVILAKPANLAGSLITTLEQWGTNSQDVNPTSVGCDFS